MTLMRREIEETPQVIERLLATQREPIARAARAVRDRRRAAAVVLGRGTSDHAAIYARYLIEAELGLSTALAAPSLTTVYRRRIDWRDLLLVAVSQSGAGPDIVEVTRSARAAGALTIAVTNDVDAELGSVAEHVIWCAAGPERSVAATKTYVASVAAISALVAKVTGDRAESQALDRMPATLADVIARSRAWVDGHGSGLVDAIAAAGRALVVSRGFNLATALEIALKLKETSSLFAEGYSSADLLHGPVALADPGVPVMVVRPRGRIGPAIDEATARVRAGGAPVWTIDGRGESGAPARSGRRSLSLPLAMPESLTPMPFVIPGYVVAEAVALALGVDPDAPEGLTKITRTR